MHTFLAKILLYFYTYNSDSLHPEPNKHLNSICKISHIYSFYSCFHLWGFSLIWKQIDLSMQVVRKCSGLKLQYLDSWL